MSTLALSAALALAHACAPTVAPGTLLSVAMTESRLTPTAIHDNTTGRSYFPADTAAAVALASRLIASGDNIDGGIAQVNSANWPRLGLSVADAFDPCRSMAAGARVLVENYHGGGVAELPRTLSAYNAGPRGAFQAAYVRRVEAAAAQIVPEIRVPGVPALPVPAAPVPCTAPTDDGWHVTVAPDCRAIRGDGWHVTHAPVGAASNPTGESEAAPVVLHSLPQKDAQ